MKTVTVYLYQASFLLLVIFLTFSSARAEDYSFLESLVLNSSNPVVHRERSNGGEAMPSGVVFDSLYEFAGATQAEQVQVAAMMQERIKDMPRMMENLVTLQPLPACEKDAKALLPAGGKSNLGSLVDYIFYDPLKPREATKAKRWHSRAVPYASGKTFGMGKAGGDARALLAVTLGVRCLPARIRFTDSDGTYAIEYREGKLAWEETEEDKMRNDYR